MQRRLTQVQVQKFATRQVRFAYFYQVCIGRDVCDHRTLRYPTMYFTLVNANSRYEGKFVLQRDVVPSYLEFQKKHDLCNIHQILYGNVDTLKMGGTFGRMETTFFPVIGCYFRANFLIVQLNVNQIVGAAHKREQRSATKSKDPLDIRNR